MSFLYPQLDLVLDSLDSFLSNLNILKDHKKAEWGENMILILSIESGLKVVGLALLTE